MGSVTEIRDRTFLSNIDCCGNFDITDKDMKEFQFWEIIYSDANKIFDKIVSNEAFGTKDNCPAQALMDVHHLLFFLQKIQEERDFDAANSTTGNDNGNLYYIDKYCIKAIRDRFYCKGFTIQTILQVFDLFDLVHENTGPNDYLDGIGYMQIEGTTPPINRVL